jgi:hypothetical protein
MLQKFKRLTLLTVLALIAVWIVPAQNGTSGPIINPDGSCCAAPLQVDCSQVCGPGCPSGAGAGTGDAISMILGWLLTYAPSLVM